uniref:Uncharacterized protein n=1 Tax=Glossina brevipalpis TaxID=37001 RepID=A0A1A9WLJ9_9MUSC
MVRWKHLHAEAAMENRIYGLAVVMVVVDVGVCVHAVQPLYDVYQREVELNLWEPINRYWAECYEACKIASKKRGTLQADNRALFQTISIRDLYSFPISSGFQDDSDDVKTTHVILEKFYNDDFFNHKLKPAEMLLKSYGGTKIRNYAYRHPVWQSSY